MRVFRVERFNDYRILWIKWFGVFYSKRVNSEKILGIWRSKYGVMFYFYRFGIGCGVMADYYRKSIFGR